MKDEVVTQKTIFSDTYLLSWVEAFLIDRKVSGLAKGTIKYYRNSLRSFSDFCEGQVVTEVTQITPTLLRKYILLLEEQGYRESSIHGFYRAVKAFLRWWEQEYEPENWKNPIRKVKSPKVDVEPLDPVEIPYVKLMVAVCPSSTYFGIRDKAILLCLLDSGARAQEFLDVDVDDVNSISGEILIRRGKGGKPRSVYLGSLSRKALRKYLKVRSNHISALWVNRNNERLRYDGLRDIITRRAKEAGIEPPSLHSFRRAFAINMLRSGVDIYHLKELMGHESLSPLLRYLKFAGEDLQMAHRKGSPVDNLF